MKKVFVVLGCVDYEGQSIVAMYSTAEAAETRKSAENDNLYRYSFEHFEVEEWEVL